MKKRLILRLVILIFITCLIISEPVVMSNQLNLNNITETSVEPERPCEMGEGETFQTNTPDTGRVVIEEPAGPVIEEPARPVIPGFVSGIFVAPELSSGATEEEWVDSLQNMADIGIDTVIIQYVYQLHPIYGTQAYFHYWQEDTGFDAGEHPLRRYQVGWILAAAQKTGMQVFLGLQLAELEWFDLELYRDPAWLVYQNWLSADLAGSLWDEFGQEFADTIAGWYLPFEFESAPRFYDYFGQLTQLYYAPLTTFLKDYMPSGDMPILISPLMYRENDKEAWKRNLGILLSGSRIDIVAPQDGIGYGTQFQDTVGPWFRSSREAVDAVNAATGSDIRLWANCENYVRLRNPYETELSELLKPMSINKFIRSMDIAAPYVEKIISFSIHRWDTAQQFNRELGINRSYFEAYKRYFETGLRSMSISNGYYVSIQPIRDHSLYFNAYATAGLTDGFATGTDWSQFKGISSPDSQPFTLEIRFDYPVIISNITSHYYRNLDADISFPHHIRYQYLVRSGHNDEIFTYVDISNDQPLGNGSIVRSYVSLAEPVPADGVLITITPGSKWTFLDEIWVR